MKTNLELQEDVRDKLRWNPMLYAAEIEIFAKNGLITLTGKVDTHLMKIEAEKTAKKVVGVNAVIVDIEVKSVCSKCEDLEMDALNALKWQSLTDIRQIVF